MEWYVPVKYVHIATAVITLSLMLLRLGLDLIRRPDWRGTLLSRLPHINDSLLLLSALFLLGITGWNPFLHAWLGIKLLLVVSYIVSGWFALRVQLATRHRVIAAGFVLLHISAIIWLATTKPM